MAPRKAQTCNSTRMSESEALRFFGTYVANEDGKSTEYSYEIAWFETKYGTNWYAKVHHDGMLSGVPNGTLMGVAAEKVAARLRAHVEIFIEKALDKD